MIPEISMSVGGATGAVQVAGAVKIFLFITLISVGPALLLTMTSFTRIVIVLSFLRQAIGVHQSPPNQVIIGLSLFLTFFLMQPVIKQVHEEAITPFLAEEVSVETALSTATVPIKKFMVAQTRKSDLALLFRLSKEDKPANMNDLSMTMVIPAFILSELRTAFEIGFLIYLPFILIDLVVSMMLLTMGMMVLPPILISLPFKLMLFVLVDGWNVIVGSLIGSFR